MKREARVAFSVRAQPVWFRALKWIVIISVVAVFRRSPYLWWGILGAFSVGLMLHLLWRWKTKGWTQPWGEWNDLEAGKRD